MQSPPFPRYLVPPRSKYSTQHPVLKHPQLPFLPQCQRPSFTPIQNRQNYSFIYLDTKLLAIVKMSHCMQLEVRDSSDYKACRRVSMRWGLGWLQTGRGLRHHIRHMVSLPRVNIIWINCLLLQSLFRVDIKLTLSRLEAKQDMHCTYTVTLRRVRATIVAVDKR